jgi:hypothetical protein
MADAPKILGTDSLRQAYPKLNSAIDNSNEALNKSATAETNSTAAVNMAIEANAKSDDTQTQLNAVVNRETDSDAMSAQAAVDAHGVNKVNLKQRLDDDYNEVTSALAQKANESNLYSFMNFKRKQQIADTVYGQKRINVLGDSISHGAHAPDIVNDSWTGIMRKFIQQEFNVINYGYVNLLSMGAEYTDAISVSWTGAWTQNGDQTYLGAYKFYSVDSTAKLTITINQSTPYFKMFMEKNPVYGKVDVVINGTVVTTIDCSLGNPYKSAISSQISLSGYNFPVTVDLVKKDSKATTFCGIGLYNNENNVVFNNYGRSGLSFVEVDDSILYNVSQANTLIMALGHNDRYGNKDINVFKAKINTLISYLNTSGAFLVVADFIWHDKPTDQFRQELKRLADSVPNSIYIPFPDFLWGSDDSWITNGFLYDFSHPTELGHKIVAETIAKKMGLGVTNKETVVKLLGLTTSQIKEISGTTDTNTTFSIPYPAGFNSTNTHVTSFKVLNTNNVWVFIKDIYCGASTIQITLGSSYPNKSYRIVLERFY